MPFGIRLLEIPALDRHKGGGENCRLLFSYFQKDEPSLTKAFSMRLQTFTLLIRCVQRIDVSLGVLQMTILGESEGRAGIMQGRPIIKVTESMDTLSEPSSETASSTGPANALKPPRPMWDLCSDPHTCGYCQRVIVEPPESIIQGGLKNPRFDVQFPHTKAEALQALSDGCPLFIWLIKSNPNNWKRIKRAPENTPFASMTFFLPDRVAIPGAGSDGLSPIAAAGS
jgi:hypothetical protein